ncbi:uncharacterized protein LOC135501707 [Lineus longissimus]|uniref:uncharacterized protein LOC135501707 n=1 Tax=Lineus longissimus TaxID=88925 RepID=UPI00315C6A11
MADFVVRFLLDRILHSSQVNGILRTIEEEIRQNIAELFSTCEKLEGDGDLLTQLKCCYTIDLTTKINVPLLSEKIMKKTLFMRICEVVEDVTCLADVNERQWKEETCRHLLESIDSEELGRIICDQLCGELMHAHKHFKTIFKMVASFIESVHAKVKSYEPFIAPLSKHICILSSLDSSVRHGHVELLQLIERGHRCEVYRCKRTKTKAVARLVPSDRKHFSEFAEMLNFQRNLTHYHENLLKAFDISRDTMGRVVALVPYAGVSLFQELTDGMAGSYATAERLEIGRQIISVCKFVREKGFSLVDLRPNNILLKNGHPKIDLCKPRGLDIPYPPPDNKPPFHFAPEVVSNSRKRNVGDGYSGAMILWFLACGRFIRPDFANKPSVEAVNDIIINDLDSVRQDLCNILDRVRLEHIWKLDGSPRLLRNVAAILKEFIVPEDERKPIDSLYDRCMHLINE